MKPKGRAVKTDDEINALVAEHVAGWTDFYEEDHGSVGLVKLGVNPASGNDEYVTDFVNDSNAVLRLLDKCERGWHASNAEAQSIHGRFMVSFDGHVGRADTFPRAACLALLRAKGIEV